MVRVSVELIRSPIYLLQRSTLGPDPACFYATWELGFLFSLKEQAVFVQARVMCLPGGNPGLAPVSFAQWSKDVFFFVGEIGSVVEA